MAFDVTDGAAASTALESLLEAGPIQVLVNNAGVHDDAPLAGMTHEQWRRVIDVSLEGFYNVTKALVMPMARTRWGRIVSISSGASARLGPRGQSGTTPRRKGRWRRPAARSRARWEAAASP